MSAGGQDIYTTQRKNHEAKLRAKDKEIERLEALIAGMQEQRETDGRELVRLEAKNDQQKMLIKEQT